MFKIMVSNNNRFEKINVYQGGDQSDPKLLESNTAEENYKHFGAFFSKAIQFMRQELPQAEPSTLLAILKNKKELEKLSESITKVYNRLNEEYHDRVKKFTEKKKAKPPIDISVVKEHVDTPKYRNLSSGYIAIQHRLDRFLFKLYTVKILLHGTPRKNLLLERNFNNVIKSLAKEKMYLSSTTQNYNGLEVTPEMTLNLIKRKLTFYEDLVKDFLNPIAHLYPIENPKDKSYINYPYFMYHLNQVAPPGLDGWVQDYYYVFSALNNKIVFGGPQRAQWISMEIELLNLIILLRVHNSNNLDLTSLMEEKQIMNLPLNKFFQGFDHNGAVIPASNESFTRFVTATIRTIIKLYSIVFIHFCNNVIPPNLRSNPFTPIQEKQDSPIIPNQDSSTSPTSFNQDSPQEPSNKESVLETPLSDSNNNKDLP